mmetsp:Transcript_28601/g.77469  ORF Transcript_28601/g.77469 Transcript_28601/m.77469 type:complete len:257 (-) Transcript_28601:221-991(-)
MTMGMMHEGYFVGRKELINWIRQNFDPGFSKIEDLASGVVYCQIVDKIYPTAVPMAKVKMSAKTEVDFIHNFKILQTSFGKKKIDRFVDVDKLTKRSFQHNMEFLQFMKCYWDMHAPEGAGPVEGAPLEEAVVNEQPQARAPPPARKEQPSGLKRAPVKPPPAPAPPPPPPPAHEVTELKQNVDSLEHERDELKLSVDNLERERDFYYMKLREVEVLCQQHEAENVPFLQQVLEILYKTDDADEFVNPEQQEQIPA